MTQEATATIPPDNGWNLHAALYDPKVRGIVYQIITIALLVAFGWWVSHNTAANLRAGGQSLSYDFIDGRAGFNIGQSLIAYSSDSTYGRAFVVGFLNTMLVAVSGIVLATIVGFIVGLGRLSHNWLIAQLSTVYVEIFRNIPPPLVIFFWFSGVLSVFPQPKEPLHLPL